jgi:anti-sigma factor RsiW
MSCHEYQILLHRELDGRLSGDDGKLLATHLEGCPRCAADRVSLETMRGALRDLRHADVAPGLADRIIERAREPRAPIFRIPRLALIPVAASVLALCLVSGALGWHLREPDTIKATFDKRLDERDFRRFLSEDLALSAEQVDQVLKVRHEFDQKIEAAKASVKDEVGRLERAEIEEMWKWLPDEARRRYLAHDRTFTPPESQPRPR